MTAPTGRPLGRPPKITAQQVRAIRTRYARGGISQQALAREYGLAQASVCAIVRRLAWRDVP
jgi:DNA-binding MarR family transcriptional regulator